MLRVISKLRSGAVKALSECRRGLFSYIHKQRELREKTFEEKAAFYERFQNSYVGGDRLQDQIDLVKALHKSNGSREVILERIVTELKGIYGKNYEKILETRFSYEIQGHRDGVIQGEFEIFPRNVFEKGRFSNPTHNADLLDQLHASTCLSINAGEVQTHVVNDSSHFSLVVEDFVADEYVSELADNQVCLFGFPRSFDTADIHHLIENTLQGKCTNIHIGECVFSLPAYAILTFPDKSDALAFHAKIKTNPLGIEGTSIHSTTFEDSRKEHSSNRTLIVSGFNSSETFNDLLTFLSSMGCVMHFEMVEEPVHEALPTTDDVLAYLKKSLKEGDNSVIYEITDISDGVHTIVEYPPHTPHVEFTRDGKRLSEINDEIALEKERHLQLAKRQLIPRIVIFTWDSEKLVPEEYSFKNASPEQQKILKANQNNIRHEFKNKQYLFVTFACLRQAQMALHTLNRTCMYEALLKKSTEHYHCDTSHQTSIYKKIKQVTGDVKAKFNDEEIQKMGENKLLAQSHQEVRETLLEQANSHEFQEEISALLEKEMINKTKHGMEHQLHVRSEKIGRDFSAKVQRKDINQIGTQLQQRQLNNMDRLDSLRKKDEDVMNMYRAKVLNADFNKIAHPFKAYEPSLVEDVLENARDQAATLYQAKQKEYLKEEQIKQRWIEETQELIEKKMQFIPKTKYTRKPKVTSEELPGAKEPAQPDQYYAPFSDYALEKKKKKYERYVGEMQRLYDGEYTEAMKHKVFTQGGQKCTDADGEIFVSEELGEEFDRETLSDEMYSTLEYYKSIADVMPNKRVKELQKLIEDDPEETLYMLKQLQFPTRVFDRNQIPGLTESEIPCSNEEFAEQLNTYVAELGQQYAVQRDARGDEKIVMYENEVHPVPLHALNVDEIKLLRDCLSTYGFNPEAVEVEIQYFIKHGDYSPEVLKIVESNPQQIDEDAELDQLINATGLSKAELESILAIDLEKEGGKVGLSLQRQREEAAFDIKMAMVHPQDLIKTNTKLRNKDKQGKYRGSAFKFF